MKYLIFNADDFGASTGINRGVIQCHTRGVVTSASLMVTGRALAEAVAMSRDYPALSLGLHWDVWGEGEPFDITDIPAVQAELQRQLELFHRLLGRPPTHIDSHRHPHRQRHLRPVFRKAARSLGVPLRDDGPVRYVSRFYGQDGDLATRLDYVSVPFLQQRLREVEEGWTEFSCHPGYVSPDFDSIYHAEREAELRTLTDPRIRETIEALGIRLASYADYRAAVEGRPE